MLVCVGFVCCLLCVLFVSPNASEGCTDKRRNATLRRPLPNQAVTPREVQQLQPSGSEMMADMLGCLKQVNDLYTDAYHMRQNAIAAHLLEPPPDPRMRTMMGRRLVQLEHESYADDEAAASQTDNALGALDQFTKLFEKK